MRIVPASATILDDLDRQSMARRIESCGRLCYKSEDRITDSSAEPFIRKVMEYGHNSVMEMAALSLRVYCETEAIIDQFLAAQPKYMQIDRPAKKEKMLLVSGTVRAFREIYQNCGNVKLVKGMTAMLAQRHPLFFFDLAGKRGFLPQTGVEVEKLTLAEVDALPADLLVKHRHLAVRFITNRAVTHELVRHRPCSFLQESQRYCRYSQDKFGNEVTFIRPLFYAEGSEEYRLWQQAMQGCEKIYLQLLETSSPQAARTVLPNSCKTEIIVYANLLEWLHIFRLRTTRAAEPSMREVMNPLLLEMQRRFPGVFDALQGE
ncbi:FAD-dependent thymidylate synthase [Desulfurivibrio alkaliphilus]|uniref:Thymidylate synthase complementing protein ThyX n=1 Tax=Desulfurivibrio alkaliphilus (strain DSM 19089 / UNIQEM U267 / AHT2) TaxID=589865 RepID=D6Z1W7_DESAT|nr:FAD-dependent thymidylate synthase [Desulfurivibrio alkaliphilus]ADH85542.1 thymidylate synthase complementing protein ThyX [Desulfurivibrio alkaliphilus AHT 2]